MVFARACRDAGIRSIIGVELTVAVDPDADPDAHPGSRHDLTLLAETRQGYANLCRLVSLANGWGLVEQADRERRRRDPCAALHHVREHTAGVVCLTGGRAWGAGRAGGGRRSVGGEGRVAPLGRLVRTGKRVGRAARQPGPG